MKKSVQAIRITIISILLCLSAGLSLHAQWDKDVFMWRGRSALSDGKYALAIENFNILTRLDTTDNWSFFFRDYSGQGRKDTQRKPYRLRHSYDR